MRRRGVASSSRGLGSRFEDLIEHGADVVIHSAATVSFDSALDDAVEVNLYYQTTSREYIEFLATQHDDPAWK